VSIYTLINRDSLFEHCYKFFIGTHVFGTFKANPDGIRKRDYPQSFLIV